MRWRPERGQSDVNGGCSALLWKSAQGVRVWKRYNCFPTCCFLCVNLSHLLLPACFIADSDHGPGRSVIAAAQTGGVCSALQTSLPSERGRTAGAREHGRKRCGSGEHNKKDDVRIGMEAGHRNKTAYSSNVVCWHMEGVCRVCVCVCQATN